MSDTVRTESESSEAAAPSKTMSILRAAWEGAKRGAAIGGFLGLWEFRLATVFGGVVIGGLLGAGIGAWNAARRGSEPKPPAA